MTDANHPPQDNPPDDLRAEYKRLKAKGKIDEAAAIAKRLVDGEGKEQRRNSGSGAFDFSQFLPANLPREPEPVEPKLLPAAKRKVLYSETVKSPPGERTLADLTIAERELAKVANAELGRWIRDFLGWLKRRGVDDNPALDIAQTQALLAEYRADRARPKDPFRPKWRASLPRLHRMGEDEAQLPDFPEPADALPRQLDLPGFQPPVTACPSWLLWLYDQAGGKSMAQGRGAPWPLRLFVGALLHLWIDERDGQWHTLRFPTDEVIGWLHPDGWENRRRDWERFPAALDDMRSRLGYVPVPGLGSVAMLVPSVIPRKPSDPLVEFTIRIPSVAAKGASIDWPTLCQYGKESSARYRAYLRRGRLHGPVSPQQPCDNGRDRRTRPGCQGEPEATEGRRVGALERPAHPESGRSVRQSTGR